MEPRYAQAREPDPWTIVSRWPRPQGGDKAAKGLKAEPKLVWSYLYRMAGGIERSAIVHASQIAFETGLSDQAARRALLRLADWGLIDIPDRDRLTGAVTIYVKNPLEVAKARLTPGTGHGQGLLWADEPQPCPEEEAPALRIGPGATSPVEPAADGAEDARMASSATEERAASPPSAAPESLARRISPPEAAPHLPPPEAARNKNIEDLGAPLLPPRSGAPLSLKVKHKEEDPMRARAIQGLSEGGGAPHLPPRSGADSPSELALALATKEKVRRFAQRDPEPVILGGIVDRALAKLPSPAERAAHAEQLIQLILSRVADPSLQRGPAERAAWAVVDGVLPEAKLHEVLRYVDKNAAEGTLKGARWTCFVGTIKIVFGRLGIPWQKGADK